jgi:hypothetical protein
MKRPMIDTMERPKFDNLFTPVKAMKPLLKYIPKDRSKVFWECCDPGGSNITKVLREEGYDVIESDIVNGFDFFEDYQEQHFDMVITNPPYSLKNKFIDRCYEYGKPFALLLPLTALEGKARGNLFRRYGMSVLVLDSRLDFTGKGANWFATAWFCWNIIDNNKLIFETVE